MPHIKAIKNKNLIYPLLLGIITFSAYSISINYQFLGCFDDNGYITQNMHLTFTFDNIKYWFTHACVGCYLPLTMLSYMFDYAIWGFNSFGYHLQNIFWHIVVVITVYKCFRLFDIKSWIAFFICLIFAVHPQRVESVVWISERKDVLCAAFYFLSIYFYIKKTMSCSSKKNTFPILSFIFFIFAIFSKPMAVSLPIILLIYEWNRLVASGEWRVRSKKQRAKNKEQRAVISEQWSVANKDNDQLTVNNKLFITQRDKSKGKREKTYNQSTINNEQLIESNQQINKSTNQQINTIRRLIPFFIVLAIFIPITLITQSNIGAIKSSNSILSINRIFSVIYNFFWYFSQTLFPLENTPIYYPHIISIYSVLEIIIFYLSIIILLIVLYIKNRKVFLSYVLPLISTYILTLLPIIGILRIGSTDHADRYSYIPSVFIWFSIGLFINKLIYSKNQTKILLTKKRKKELILILVFYLITVIILNFNYQKYWPNQYILFSYAASKPKPIPNILCILGDIAITKNDYSKVLFVAEKLEKETKNNSLSAFYRASVIYRFDRKKAINLLIQILYSLKLRSDNNLDRHLFYPRALRMLINSFSYTGNKQQTIKYIDKLLEYEKINTLDINLLRGTRAEYKNNYKKAISFYKQALKLAPDNIHIQNKIKTCLSLENKKNSIITNSE